MYYGNDLCKKDDLGIQFNEHIEKKGRLMEMMKLIVLACWDTIKKYHDSLSGLYTTEMYSS